MANIFPSLSSRQTDSPLTMGPPVGETSPVEEERPVQGPLPYEPDDAPWKKSESGIRKFFRKLFSETSTVSFLPTPATNRTPTWTSPAPSPRHRPPPVSSTELKPLHR
uniref:RILP-like protein homolog n=1 Tax=Cacopsylla melanoneura TaxID=428564 RepID=A0A8D8LXF6_9HEMI